MTSRSPAAAPELHARPPVAVDGGSPQPTGWVDHTWAGSTWLAGDQLIRCPDPAADPHGAGAYSPQTEVDRLRWLADALGHPSLTAEVVATEVVAAEVAAVARPDQLVVAKPPGVPASRPDLHPRPDSIPALIGAAVAQLHAIPTADCPFDAPVNGSMAAVVADVDAGRLDPALLPAPYDRYESRRLLEMLDAGPTPDRAGANVVVHGALVLSNIWLPPDGDSQATTGGVVLTGPNALGVGDRHADLAVLHRQLHLAFGPEAVFAFHEAYGGAVDLVALDHQLLFDVMRSAIVRPEPAPPGTVSVLGDGR